MTNYPTFRYCSSPTTGTGQFNVLRNGIFPDPAGNAGGARETRRGWYPNRCIKFIRSSASFQGRVIFANIRNLIQYSDQDGSSGTWGTARTITGGDSSTNAGCTNFVVCTGSNGVPYVVVGMSITGGSLAICRWVGTSPLVTDWIQEAQGIGNYAKLMAHEGKVFYRESQGVSATTNGRTYDPVTRSFASANFPFGPAGGYIGDYFTLNKRLFHAVYFNGGLSVVEYTLGTWTTVGSPFISYMHNNPGSSRQVSAHIKLSENKVLVFAAGNNGPGFGLECALLQISGGVLTQTRVTDTVVPPILRGPGSVGVGQRYNVIGFSDNAETPGSPRHYLWFDPDCNVSGAAISLLEVVDESTQATILGTTGITNDHSVPGWPCGGEQVFTPSEVSVVIHDQDKDAQGLRIFYRASGDPGAADKTVSFRYTNSYGVPVGVCTLVPGSAVGGGTVVGNTVTGVDADQAIIHEVVWDFLTDGVPDGSYVHNQAFIVRP